MGAPETSIYEDDLSTTGTKWFGTKSFVLLSSRLQVHKMKIGVPYRQQDGTIFWWNNGRKLYTMSGYNEYIGRFKSSASANITTKDP